MLRTSLLLLLLYAAMASGCVWVPHYPLEVSSRVSDAAQVLFGVHPALEGSATPSTPLHSPPLPSTPLHSLPLPSTPLHSPPLHSTPLHSPPLSPKQQPILPPLCPLNVCRAMHLSPAAATPANPHFFVIPCCRSTALRAFTVSLVFFVVFARKGLGLLLLRRS
jgi:hypothetical protein